MSDRSVDLLVVGGGPAGLSAAAAAAHRGVHTVVVHRDREIGRPVRTSGGSWRGALTRLGIPEHLWHPVTDFLVAGPSTRHRVRFNDEQPVVLDVTRTYQYLADQARTAGAEILTETRCTSVRTAADSRWRVTLQRPGCQQEVTTRWIVDGSGWRRTVLTLLDHEVPFPRFGVGCEHELATNPEDDNELCVVFLGDRWAPSGYGWVFPTGRGSVCVGVGVLRPDTGASPGVLLRQFLSSPLAQELMLTPDQTVIDRHAGIIPASGLARRFVFPGVVAVGDAAGQALPLVGEGIRFAILSGQMAGTGVAACIAGTATAQSAFAPYRRWWRRQRARFALAQAVNLRLARFSDRSWDAGVQALQRLDGDGVARVLRLEPTVADLFRLGPGTLLKTVRSLLTG